MEFKSVFVSNPAHLSVRKGQLIIKQEREVSIPMEDMSSLLIESRFVTLTAASLQELADNGVTVYFCDAQHMPATVALPINRHSRQLRMLKSQIAMGVPAKKQLWKSVVTAKVENQAKCLRILQRPNAEEIKYMAKTIRSGDVDNVEASAAALYFPSLFGPGFFRAEECRINAALNYGYAILRGAVARNLVMHGLEPCLGIFHHSEVNQFNLADDLMEPFRPVVDLFVAMNIPDDQGILTSRQKQELFNITNCLVRQNNKNYRLISAVGRAVQSYSRAIRDGTPIELPVLLPIEHHSYE